MAVVAAVVAIASAVAVEAPSAQTAAARAYVTNDNSNTVSVIDTGTNAVVATIGVGNKPTDVAFTADGTRAYVINFFSGTVSVIDTVTTAGPIPTVVLPEGGSDTPITATVATGEALFGVGLNPFFSSGPITVSTQGTPAGGTVTSRAEMSEFNPSGLELLTADALSSTCEATDAGVTRSATVTGGRVVTDTGDDDPANLVPDHPPVVEGVPANPAPNTEIAGHFHDPTSQENFRYVFNEQVTSPDGSPTVNAAHAYIEGPTVFGELVIGRAVCNLATLR